MIRVRGASGLAVVALTASACGMGGQEAASTGPAGGGHLVYAEQLSPMAAWALATDDAHLLMRAGCLETLVRYEKDGTLGQSLATEWKQVQPTVWQFTLRQGVTFQDGTPLDANAVAGALTHLLKAKSPARSFNPKVVSSVKATDASTVQVATPAPDALVPLRVANPNSGILAPKAYAGNQMDIRGTCTGPFTVVEEQPRQLLKLKRNDSYWGGKPKIETAEVRFVVDGATRATQVQTGEAQIAKSIPAANRSALEGDSKIKLAELALPRTTMMLLNNSRPPFDDPLVRKAIQHAINLDPIVQSVYEGTGEPAAGPFAPESPWAPDGAKPATFSLDDARNLLNQAGVQPSSLNIELIAYNDRPEFDDLAAVIQDQLSQLGIKVKIRAGEYASVEPDMLAGEFDAALLSRGYLTDVGDPAGFLLADYTCEGTYNIAHYCNPQTEASIKQAVALQDLEARNEAYGKIAETLQSEAPAVYLVHESAVWASQAEVQNFTPHPLDYYVLTDDLALGGS